MVFRGFTMWDALYLNSQLAKGERYIFSVLPEYGDELIKLSQTNPDLFLKCDVFESDLAKRTFGEDNPAYLQILNDNFIDFCNLYNECQKLCFPASSLLDELCVYATRYLNYDAKFMQEGIDRLFLQTLKMPEYLRSYKVYNFIMKYLLNRESTNLNIPCPISKIVDYNHNKRLSNINAEGTYTYSLDMISINKTLISDRDRKYEPSKLAYVLHVLFHELKHSAQWHKYETTDESRETFDYVRRSLFDKYLFRNSETTEYKSNYEYDEIEIAAEIYGWSRTYKRLNAISLLKPEEKIQIIKYIRDLQFKSLLRVKKAEKGPLMPAYIYNVENTNLILQNNSKAINNHRLLSCFYNKNGSPKSFVELLVAEKKYLKSSSDSSLRNTFADYYRYNLTHDFDFNQLLDLSIRVQSQVISKIFDMIILDLKTIQSSISSYVYVSDRIDNAFEIVTTARVNEILKMYNIVSGYYAVNQNKESAQGILKSYKSKFIIMKKYLKEIKRYSNELLSTQNIWAYSDVKRLLKIKLHTD